MLCQKCNAKQATCHYRSSTNGKTEELHLCQECYQEIGFPSNEVFEGLPDFGPSSFFPVFFGQPAAPRVQQKTCPLCGGTFDEIARSAKVGCGKCYSVFSDQLAPFLSRLHGGARHAGSAPESAGKEIALKQRLSNLKNEMQAAINAQNFERAAELRDQLKDIEAGENEVGS